MSRTTTNTPTVNLQLEVGLPMMPNFVTLRGVRRADMGSAIANGEEIRIDVVDLDDNAVEQFITRWGEAFREHVKKRRARPTSK